MKRADHRDAGGGLWETISGRVGVGEQPIAAIEREIAEETGFEVAVDPRPVDAYAALRGDAPMMVIVYRARLPAAIAGDDAPAPVLSEEHSEGRWVTPEEFRRLSTLTRLADSIDLCFE